jgi:hypothetical protein
VGRVHARYSYPFHRNAVGRREERTSGAKAGVLFAPVTAGLKRLRKNAVSRKEQPPQGLKPELISRGLRGPEGPLFHGKAPHL